MSHNNHRRLRKGLPAAAELAAADGASGATGSHNDQEDSNNNNNNKSQTTSRDDAMENTDHDDEDAVSVEILQGETIVTPAQPPLPSTPPQRRAERPSKTDSGLLAYTDPNSHPLVDKAKKTSSLHHNQDAQTATSATLKRLQKDFEERHAVRLDTNGSPKDTLKDDGVRKRHVHTAGSACTMVNSRNQPLIASKTDEQIAAAKKARELATTAASRGRAATLKKIKLAAQLAELDGLMVVPAPNTLRSSVTTVYSRHQDFYPDDNKRYYMPLQSTARRLCLVIPCYNEPSIALKRTLKT